VNCGDGSWDFKLLTADRLFWFGHYGKVMLYGVCCMAPRTSLKRAYNTLGFGAKTPAEPTLRQDAEWKHTRWNSDTNP